MAKGIKIDKWNASSNDHLSDMSYSGPERRLQDSPEFFGYFMLECIERRQNGYSLLRPVNELKPATQ